MHKLDIPEDIWNLITRDLPGLKDALEKFASYRRGWVSVLVRPSNARVIRDWINLKLESELPAAAAWFKDKLDEVISA
jgi:hypothetical protein